MDKTREEELADLCHAALNRLTKWRTVFAGWQCGTLVRGIPEGDAVRDHRELSIILQVETLAILRCLLKKASLTQEEFDRYFERERPMIALRCDDIKELALEEATFQAVADHRGMTMFQRAHSSALLCLLIDKGIITGEEYYEAMIAEAGKLEKDYEERFPGISAFENGLHFDQRAVETMKYWKV